jgi:GAF domain-containing protein
MRSQSWIMSAPMTSRFGSFLNEDLAPRVAASLRIAFEHHKQSQRKKRSITIGDQNRYRVERAALR